MAEKELQALCERGQAELMQTLYLDAARTLARAERMAWEAKSFDTLARLYLPLQEARRQIRQRCGEGAVRMHLFPRQADQSFDADVVVRETPHGQLLVGGWGTTDPAVQVRKLTAERYLYLETFLVSVQSGPDGQLVVRIHPTDDWKGDCLRLALDEIPADADAGNADSYARVMALWERLHKPFLAAAGLETDPIRRMEAYRLTLRVDPACELAHQFLADIARRLARS